MFSVCLWLCLVTSHFYFHYLTATLPPTSSSFSVFLTLISTCVRTLHYLVPSSLRVWRQHRNESGAGSASPSASPQHTVHKDSLKKTEQRDFRAAILKRLGTYEPPQPPPPVPPRSPLHTPHLQDKTLIDQDALLSHILHYTGTYSWIFHGMLRCCSTSNREFVFYNI